MGKAVTCVERGLGRMVTRHPEAAFTHSRWIHEWFCTWSNVWFVVLGAFRLADTQADERELIVLYALLVLAGVCSAVHHATVTPLTLILDWIPIASSVVLCLWWGVYLHARASTVAACSATLLWVVVDHVHPVMPIPWGHVIWHMSAAWAADALYSDFASSRGAAM